MKCTLQIFTDDRWVDCSTITARADGGSFFEYDLDYAFEPGAEAVALHYRVDASLHTFRHWPPFLYDLIPQGNGRKFLLGELRLPDGPAADFPLVAAGAFNPIGRLRVKEAVEYFDQHVQRHDEHLAQHGFTLEEIVARGGQFHERMMVHSMLAAGTTGVQGAAPKYLLTKDRHGLWHADGALPDGEAKSHYIVKRPRGPSADDKKVLRNEAAYMAVAAAMGIRTHGTLEYADDLLFIPRFDRQAENGKVIRKHQESAASLLGLTGFDGRPSQFELLNAIRAHVTDKTAETIEFLKRDVLNLAMRNTDNHARNTAVQKIDGVIRLTPLFDFAPMYLDPEGITRAARWYHPDSKKELLQWHEVLAALDLDDEERIPVANALRDFGARMSELANYMREAGVDEDIVTFLQPGIDEQIRQLGSLGEQTW